jgi:protein phosphatase
MDHHNRMADTDEYPPAPPRAGMQTPRPPSASVQVDLAALTHPGKVRPNNEDNFLVVRFGRFLQTVATSLPDGQVPGQFGDTGYGMAVADGMGGAAAGEVASRLAISHFVALVLETPDWIMWRGEPEVEQVIDRAVGRFRDVNEEVLDQARRRPGHGGMGTTLTVALSLGEDLIVAHVGDSPVYLFRRDELHKLTRDHTLARLINDTKAARAPAVLTRLRHVLTHAIGIPETGSEPDIGRFRLADGDRLLLCTDGLTGLVDDATIAAALRREASSDAACRALVDLALERGGTDNVTVVVAGYRVPPGP